MPDVVEKAAKAIYEARRPKLEHLNPQLYFQRWDELQSESIRDQAIVEAQAVVDELGLNDRVSFLAGYIAACSDRQSGFFPGNDGAVKTFAERAWKQTGVSDWRPGEQGDTK